MLFDIENLFKKVKLTEKEKSQLIKEVKAVFPDDEMMFELHLMRVINHLEKRETIQAKVEAEDIG